MKLLNLFVSMLALSNPVSGRVIVGADNKTWSPAKVPSECEVISKHLEDFVHVHKNDLDEVCAKFPDSYKSHCSEIVRAKYPPSVVCEVLKTYKPVERTYWLAFLG